MTEQFLQRIRDEFLREAAVRSSPIPPIRVDWTAYFAKFKEVHGKWPLMHAGMLLFPDGWKYGMSFDHSGPEVPPPEDKNELLELRRSYWKLRRHAVKRELREMIHLHESLTELVATRSAPLEQERRRFSVTNEMTGAGTWENENRPLSTAIEDVEQHIKWLREDLVESTARGLNPDWEPDLSEEVAVEQRS